MHISTLVYAHVKCVRKPKIWCVSIIHANLSCAFVHVKQPIHIDTDDKYSSLTNTKHYKGNTWLFGWFHSPWFIKHEHAYVCVWLSFV